MGRRTITTEEWLQQAQWMQRLARSLVVDSGTADDLTQDAWLAALRSPPDGERPLRPWFGRVVANLARNTHRGEERRRARERAAWVERSAPPAGDVAAELELQRMLLDAVESLAEPFRSTLVRAFFRQQSSREIALADGVAEGTVRWRVHHALGELRARLDERHGGNRSAWSALLAPIAARSPAVSQASMAASAAGTVFLMGTWVKIAFTTVAVAMAALFLRPESRHDGLTREAAVETTRIADELEEVSGGRVAREALVAAPAPAEPGIRSEAPRAHPDDQPMTPSRIEARLVDARGDPIAGGRLTVVDRVDLREISRNEAPRADAANDGSVRLEVARADASRNRGRPQATPPDEWSLAIEASGPAHASKRHQVDLRAGQTTSLGTIVLEDGGHLDGRVVDEAGLGLAGVEVMIVLPDLSLEERDSVARTGLGNKPRKYRATTIDDGSFGLTGLACGLYRATVKPRARLGAMSEAFEIRAGETTHLPPLLAEPNPIVVRGSVLGVDGNPTRAQIESRPLSGIQPQFWDETRCDAQGRFEIEPASNAPLDLHVERRTKTGEGDGDAFVRGVAVPSNGVVVRLRAPRFVTVSVRDATGGTLADYTIMVLRSGGDGMGHVYQSREPQRVRVLGMPFHLEVLKDGYEPMSQGPFDPEALPEEVTFTLQRKHGVSGTVIAVGTPVWQAEVALVRVVDASDTRHFNGFPARAEFAGRTARSAGDGTFELSIPERGRFRVVARRNAAAWAESEELDLDPARELEDIQLDFGKHGALAGRVIGFDRGANGVRFVNASRGLTWVRSVLIADDGTYAIDDLVPGEWSVRASREDLSATTRVSTSGPPDPGIRQVFVPSGGTARLDIEVAEPIAFVVTGRVSIDGSDMRSWSVTVTSPKRPYSKIAEALGRDGTFDIQLPKPGRHHLHFASGTSGSRSDAIDMELDLLPEAQGPRFDLETGSVVLEGDWPGELELAATLPGGARWTTRSRPGSTVGRRIEGLPAGRIELRATGQPTVTIDVRVGEVTRVRRDG